MNDDDRSFAISEAWASSVSHKECTSASQSAFSEIPIRFPLVSQRFNSMTAKRVYGYD